MLEKFFFDSSSLLAFTRKEREGPAVIELIDSIKPAQRITSVLVAYECYRGIPQSNSKRKAQVRELDALFSFFTIKAIYRAQAMEGARLCQYSKGAIDPILAAQCVDGGYTMVTVNRKDFERVPRLRLYNFAHEC